MIRDVGIVGFTNPALRGFNSAAAGIQPCGGYKLMGRTDYPISTLVCLLRADVHSVGGGQISFAQTKDASNVSVYYSTNASMCYSSADDVLTEDATLQQIRNLSQTSSLCFPISPNYIAARLA